MSFFESDHAFAGLFRRFDHAATARLVPQAEPTTAADAVAGALSNAGEVSAIWFAIGGLQVIVGHRSIRSGLAVGAALAAEWVLTNKIVKHRFSRSRPSPARRSAVPTRRPSSTSFPSGHASAGGFGAVLLATSMPTGTGLGALAMLIGWSRIRLRHHHPSDVVAGLVWGAAVGSLARAVLADTLSA